MMTVVLRIGPVLVTLLALLVPAGVGAQSDHRDEPAPPHSMPDVPGDFYWSLGAQGRAMLPPHGSYAGSSALLGGGVIGTLGAGITDMTIEVGGYGSDSLGGRVGGWYGDWGLRYFPLHYTIGEVQPYVRASGGVRSIWWNPTIGGRGSEVGFGASGGLGVVFFRSHIFHITVEGAYDVNFFPTASGYDAHGVRFGAHLTTSSAELLASVLLECLCNAAFSIF